MYIFYLFLVYLSYLSLHPKKEKKKGKKRGFAFLKNTALGTIVHTVHGCRILWENAVKRRAV